jgi:hypothetical protein
MVWYRPKPGTAGKNAFESICGILTRRVNSSASAPAKPATSEASSNAPARKKKATKN